MKYKIDSIANKKHYIILKLSCIIYILIKLLEKLLSYTNYNFYRIKFFIFYKFIVNLHHQIHSTFFSTPVLR